MKKNKRSTMDAVLAIMAVFLLAFVIAMLVIYCLTGGIPDTLCTCVFAACTGEISIMGWIKTTKERNRNKEFDFDEEETV